MALEAVSSAEPGHSSIGANVVKTRLAFSTLRDVETSFDHFLFCLFVSFNLLIFFFLQGTSLYSLHLDELKITFAWINLSLLGLALLVVGPSYISRAYSAFNRWRFQNDVDADFEAVFQVGAIILSLTVLGSNLARDNARITDILGLQSPIVVMLFITLSRWLDVRFNFRLKNYLTISLFESVPKVRKVVPANLESKKPDFSFEWVELSSIKEGDFLSVLSREIVGCDGIVTEGCAEVLERRLGAHKEYRIKNVGDEIYAGSEVLQGEVTIRTTCNSQESSVTNGEATYLASLESSLDAQPKRSWKLYYSGLLFLAIVSGAFWYWWSGELSSGLNVAIALLLLQVLPKAFLVSQQLDLAVLANSLREAIYFRDTGLFRRVANVRRLLLDFDPASRLDNWAVQGFDLLDTRYESSGLLASVYAVLSKSYEELDYKLASFSRAQLAEAKLLKVQDVAVYPGIGVIGVVEGVNFTVGNEALLLDRGVELQVGDVLPNSDRESFIYVAIETQMVLRFRVSNCVEHFGRSVIDQLMQMGVRASLLTPLSAEIADVKARSMGIATVDVLSGVSVEDYVNRGLSTDDTLFFANDLTDNACVKRFPLSCSNYDERRCDISRSAVSFLRRDFGLLLKLFELAHRASKAERSIQGFAGVLSLLVMALTLLKLISPVVVVMTMVICTLYMYLSFERVVWLNRR